MDRKSQINTFSSFFRVSRETIRSLEKYEYLVINANKKLNLIGNSTINNIWNRHITDSSQVIDFVDKNHKILVDIGTGAGLPGIVLAIAANERKILFRDKYVENLGLILNRLNNFYLLLIFLMSSNLNFQ